MYVQRIPALREILVLFELLQTYSSNMNSPIYASSEKNVYRTRTIISRGSYIFYAIFQRGL